jgi:hypothetical protein
MTEFPFSNLVKNKPEFWFNLIEFYGIDWSFPSDYLYRYQAGNAKNIVLLNKGLHDLMSAKKKYKLNVVNLGLRMFQKNRDKKSEGDYRLLQEGLEVLLPYMDDRRQISFEDGAFFKALNTPDDKMLSYQKIEQMFGA